MDFVFNIDKTVAAAAYLARKQGGKITVFVLMKMMYAAERFALAEWHRPITGDSFCSMAKGPVLSRTYDLVKGSVAGSNSDMQKWSAHFSPRQGNDIHLLAEPDFDFLSDREKGALDKGQEEISGMIKANGLIAGPLHALWPEWQDPSSFGKGSIPLTLKEVLSEIVEDEEEVERICLEVQAVQSAKAALQA